MLPDKIVDLFRCGGFRNVEEEIDFIFSDDSIVEIDEKGKTLVNSALTCLRRVPGGSSISAERFRFVDGHMLKDGLKMVNRLSRFSSLQGDAVLLLEPFVRSSVHWVWQSTHTPSFGGCLLAVLSDNGQACCLSE